MISDMQFWRAGFQIAPKIKKKRRMMTDDVVRHFKCHHRGRQTHLFWQMSLPHAPHPSHFSTHDRTFFLFLFLFLFFPLLF